MSHRPIKCERKFRQGEDGFTLIETLVALMVLSLSMGLFVQSLSLATAQLKSTSDLLAAEVLAKKILAQRLSGQGDANLIEGVDPASRLNWSMASHLVKRTEGVADLTPIVTIKIDIRNSTKASSIFSLKSIEQLTVAHE